MEKLKIGIVPIIHLPFIEDPYQDKYYIINNYPKRVYEAGAIPIGLLMNDGNISEDQLSLCDAFIFPGGSKIHPASYKILEYAYEHNKPVLGICMGMQTMTIYSVLHDDGGNPLKPDEFKVIYDNMKNTNPVLRVLEDNRDIHYHEPDKNDLASISHIIKLNNDSILSNIYNKNELNVVSLHGSIVTRTGSILNIVGYSDDGLIEAVENKDLLWIGVQYHPEIDDQDPLINSFIKEVERRK